MNTNPDNRHIAYIIYFYVYLPYTSLDGMRESADVRKAREVEFGNLKSASPGEPFRFTMCVGDDRYEKYPLRSEL